MKLTIFAKKLVTKEGKTYYRYISTLKRMAENGEVEEISTQVKFKEECGAPKGESCPMNIILDKKDANFRSKIETYVDKETGEEKDYLKKTLWISKWEEGEPYVDTSMDEFIEE